MKKLKKITQTLLSTLLLVAFSTPAMAQEKDKKEPPKKQLEVYRNLKYPVGKFKVYKKTDKGKDEGKKVLMDIDLNYIAVSETTRRRIDNGDCKRVFGLITTELWKLNDNNDMVLRYEPYNHSSEELFDEKNNSAPPPIALSYYQDNLIAAKNNVMNSVTYNIPEALLKSGNLMLNVKIQLCTRHKDNDFASYDYLCMEEPVVRSFRLDDDKSKVTTIRVNTAEDSSGRDVHINDLVIPFNFLSKTDDTHYMWVHMTRKIK